MKKMSSIGKCFALFALTALSACGPSAQQSDSGDWPVYGGSNDKNHYSTLTDIKADNVSKLRLAWNVDLDSPWSASAPIEAGGVLYTATGLSIVQAFDVETGRQLWTYVPKVSEAPDKVRLQAPHWGNRSGKMWVCKRYNCPEQTRSAKYGTSNQFNSNCHPA